MIYPRSYTLTNCTQSAKATAPCNEDWAATMPSAPLTLRLRFPSTAQTATLNWTIASTAVPLNGMLRAINRDQTSRNGHDAMATAMESSRQRMPPTDGLRPGHERDGYRDGAEQATDATYRWAQAPSRRTTTNKIDPFSTVANDGDYSELAVTQATRFSMFRAMGCHDAVRMRQFNAHHGAIYIAISRDDLLPNRYRYRMRTTIGIHAGESKHSEMQFYGPTPSG